MGRKHTGMEYRDSAPPAQSGPRGSDDAVGEGVGQGGRRARPEEVLAPERPHDIPAAALGGGEDLFLVGPQQEDELKDYERLPETKEALIYAAMSRLMARRLARR